MIGNTPNVGYARRSDYGKHMKREYDFSKGVRGRILPPNAELRLPIYLSADVQAYFVERAAQKAYRSARW